MPVAVEQAVVHAPGVDAEAVERTDVRLAEREQALLELVEEIGQVPVKHAVHFNVVVFKAVQLTQAELAAIQLAKNRAAVAGAEVECKKIFHTFSLPSRTMSDCFVSSLL